MTDTNRTDVADALAVGSTLSEAEYIQGVPYVVVPDDYSVHSLEHFLLNPARLTGTRQLRDARSFIDYVKINQLGMPLTTLIFGNYEFTSFTAVLNHGDAGDPGWCDHRATYSCPLSIEWKTWHARDKHKMSQVEFAEFMENNLPNIANPPGAEMLEISRTLEAKKKVNFASGVRLSNGQNELTYEEEITGTASKGKLQIPELFTIGIPVFHGGIVYAVDARLRYRILEGGKMQMWYELVRSHLILEDAFNATWTAIKEGTGLDILNGSI